MERGNVIVIIPKGKYTILKKMCTEEERSHSTQTEVLAFKTRNILLGLERGGCSSYSPPRDTEIHACMPATMTQ